MKSMPMDTYMAESDMHTLRAAGEIMANPKRVQAAKSAAKAKIAELQSFVGDAPDSAAEVAKNGYRKVG